MTIITNTTTNTSNESNYEIYSAITVGTTTFNDSGGTNDKNKYKNKKTTVQTMKGQYGVEM